MKASDIKYKTFLSVKFWMVILFFTVHCIWKTSAQETLPEKIHVHFDKSFYLTGEEIHFKIYFTNEDRVASKIVHVDLVDVGGNIIMNQILAIDQNVAKGSYSIPYNVSEANYLFRCYTQWNLNFGSSYIYYKVIPIYNEFLDNTELNFITDPVEDDIISSVPENNMSNGLHMKVLNHEAIQRRDEVKLDIRTFDENNQPIPAQLSLAVLERRAFDQNNSNLTLNHHNGKSIESENYDIRFQPEDGIVIKGIVRNPETGATITSRVLSIFHVENVSFTRLSSRLGEFEFKIPLFEGTADLQIINMNPFQPKVPDIEWIPLYRKLPPNPDFSPLSIRNDQVKEYIFYARLRNRINEIFNSSVYDTIQLQQPPLLPFTPDRSYDMSKYQLIRDVLNFFREGVTGTSFYNEDGNQKIRLLNRETKEYFMTSPWFVVDGHFIFDDSLVHHIPFNNIRQIDIYNTNKSILKYFEPIMIQGGVVAVYTKNNFLIDYIRNMPNTLQVHGIPASNGKNAILTKNENPHETPDFNPMIYWQPNISTDENGRAKISFALNDITGFVVLSLKGMDSSGRMLTAHSHIEVMP
jgi:hypothetical protein